METKELELEIATLRSAILEVAHRLEKLYGEIKDLECPICKERDDFPNKPLRTLFSCGSTSQRVTPTQSILLEELIRRPGKIVTYDRIIYCLWESGVRRSYTRDKEAEFPKETLSAHICMTRQRIAKLNCKIYTDKGNGLSIHSEEVMSLS